MVRRAHASACHHWSVIPDPLSADCSPGPLPAGVVTAVVTGPTLSLCRDAEVDGLGRLRIGGLDVLDWQKS